jgi:hypothetical protein
MKLQPEEPLDLPPRDEREVCGEDEQREQNHPEPQPRKAALADPLLAGATTGSMKPVRAIDRSGIDRRRVLDGGRAPSRLGHAGTI